VLLQVRDRAAIRRWRAQRGYSQQDLALLCRKSQQAISNIESGVTTTVSEPFAMDIAKRLRVDWHSLFETPDASLSVATNTVHSDRAAS
jgi:putative transcriptional regulator